jgi:hypothetical protein
MGGVGRGLSRRADRLLALWIGTVLGVTVTDTHFSKLTNVVLWAVTVVLLYWFEKLVLARLLPSLFGDDSGA